MYIVSLKKTRMSVEKMFEILAGKIKKSFLKIMFRK